MPEYNAISGECEICHTISGDARCCTKCETILCPTCFKGHNCYDKIKPRPSCLECGTENPTSKGYRWRCRKCGREWVKNPRNNKKGITESQHLNSEEQIDINKVVDI